MHRFRVSSRLPLTPDEVWARVVTFEGVNHELGPLVSMTLPTGLDVEHLSAGPLGRSCVLLGGLIPIDYDDLVLEEVTPPRGFRERSRMLSATAWWHDRTLLPLAEGGCRVVDAVAFTPRVRALGGLQAFVLEAMFRWRHRRLRRWAAGARAPIPAS